METPTSLTAQQRRLLKTLVDQAVRAKLQPSDRVCGECGADLADLPAPVYGCATCAERFWRRRQRAHS